MLVEFPVSKYCLYLNSATQHFIWGSKQLYPEEGVGKDRPLLLDVPVGLIRDLRGLQRDPGAPGPVRGQEQSKSIACSLSSQRAPGGRVGFFDLFREPSSCGTGMSWKIIVKGAQKVSNTHKPIKFTLDGPTHDSNSGLENPPGEKTHGFHLNLWGSKAHRQLQAVSVKHAYLINHWALPDEEKSCFYPQTLRELGLRRNALGRAGRRGLTSRLLAAHCIIFILRTLTANRICLIF